jgi:tryptophanyl-tRNA synthetase
MMECRNSAAKMPRNTTPVNQALCLQTSHDEIRSKSIKAVIDTLRELRFDKNRPAIYNLLTIYELLTEKENEQVEEEFSGKDYAIFKANLADVIIEEWRIIQRKFSKLQLDVPSMERICE